MLKQRAVFALVLSFGAAACGGGGGEEAASSNEQAAEAQQPVANAATIRGVVNFQGTPPTNPPIDMSEEQTCAEKHGSHRPTQEQVVVSNGKLQNAFVYVKEGLSGNFTAPRDTVTIDQDGCVYTPRVVGVMTGQPLGFKNSDGILHNVKAAPSANRGFNLSQPTTMTSVRQFNTEEVMVPIQCDVHGWMHAYVGVLEHPYFAVSSNNGSFTIGNLPPGTYTLEAWHERLGTQTQSVTVGPNESKDVTFNFSPRAAAHVPLGEPLVVAHSH